jgi:hypothetical protein
MSLIERFKEWYESVFDPRAKRWREENEQYLNKRTEELAFFNSFNTQLCYNYHPVGEITVIGYVEEVEKNYPMYSYDKAVELAQEYHKIHPDKKLIIFAPIRYSVMIDERKTE